LQVYITVKTKRNLTNLKNKQIKKNIFTAIVLIVFTGSMASTEEVKDAELLLRRQMLLNPQNEEVLRSCHINLVAYYNTKAKAMKQLCFMQT
jgi:hypothetical protein